MPCSFVLSPRRRLPVLQSKSDDDSPRRPRWQWLGFGAAAIVLVWLPLAYASQAAVARIVSTRLGGEVSSGAAPGTVLLPEEIERLGLVAWLLPTGALFLAGALGGYVLGRWGERSGWRDGAGAGGLVALFAIGLAWARSGVSAAPLAVLGVVVPAAALGALLGERLRAGGLP